MHDGSAQSVVQVSPGRAGVAAYADPMTPLAGLPVSEYGFPGPLRDRLVAAIRSGQKTATTSLLLEYEREGDPMPAVGDRAVVIDSEGDPIGIEGITDVRVVRIGDVDLAHALAEGEGHTTVAAWRAGHGGFWRGDDYLAWVGDPAFRITDDTLAVLVRFRFDPL